MKRVILYTTCFLLLSEVFTACKKKLDDLYLNPESTTSANVGQLFTKMLTNGRIKPDYWDYATFVTGVTAKYSQYIGIVTERQMYIPSISYNGSRWSDYYSNGILNQYQEIQKNFKELTADQQADQYVFTQVAKVILYDQTSQIIDLWGDVPFSEAGSLNASNTLKYPKFDDAKSVYDTLINGLKDLNTYFANVTLSSVTQGSLAVQDILLGGDMDLWRRYVNSLRLRLLMRISNTNEAVAKAAVAEMLSNPASYPLVDDNSKNILLKMKPPTFQSDIQNGLADGASSSGPYASQYILENVMLANGDPRTEVFWDKGSKNTNFMGLSAATSSTDQSNQIAAGQISVIDSATFLYNYNVPGVLFTAAEVSLLKAEAYERWGGGAPETEYLNAIDQSIAFWYSVNQSKILKSGNWPSLSTPGATQINGYKTNVAYTGTQAQKLEKIATQKWVNFFLLQAGQAWAEIRRTGYPALTFANDAAYAAAPQPPVRLLYPESETVYNTENYNAVKTKDTRDTKIFWQSK